MQTEQLGHTALQEQEAWTVAQVPFVDQVRGGGAAVVWLLEMEPYLSAPAPLTMPMVAGATGILGVVGLGEEYLDVIYLPADAAVERHASLAFNTGAADVPAKTAISGRLIQDQLRVRRDLPQVNQRLGGFLAEAAGSLVIDGSDGGLDYLITQRVLRDRPVRVKSAASTRLANGSVQMPAIAVFGTNFEGRIINAEVDTDGRISMTVGDGWKRLDRPIQERLYLGTGGSEGGLDLAGKPVPLAYGNCPNVTPALIDRIKGIYQVHDGEVLAIQPRDMGVPLIFASEVDTFEQLSQMSQQGETDLPQIALGSFGLCRKQGMFRVAGGAHITADVQGDGLYDGPKTFSNGILFSGGIGFDAPGARTHRRYPAGIVYRVLFSRARVKDAELDIDQMLTFDREHPYECGIFIGTGERPTTREICARIADSAGALIVRNRFGQITLAALEEPAPTSPIQITESRLAAPVERLALPWGAPWPNLRLSFAPNWTIMTDDQISDEYADDSPEKARLLKASSFIEVTHPEIAPLLPDRETLEIQSVLRAEADALAVGRRLIDFYATRWAQWRVVVLGAPWRMDVLKTAILQLPRWDFANGKPMLVIGMEERPGEYETELTLI